MGSDLSFHVRILALISRDVVASQPRRLFGKRGACCLLLQQ
jgi:hypothetical protein